MIILYRRKAIIYQKQLIDFIGIKTLQFMIWMVQKITGSLVRNLRVFSYNETEGREQGRIW